jgi:hypothetical protein
MTTLTSSATLTLSDSTTVVESLTITALPSAPGGSGKGRLIHPTLGTYDYDSAPEVWTNMYSDAVIAPIWSAQRTLSGAASTLWAGDLRDVECTEIWSASHGLAMTVAQFAALLAMYQAPPDPATEWVEWYPSYVNALGFAVLLVNLTVGGADAMQFSGYIHDGYIDAPVELTLRIVGRV